MEETMVEKVARAICAKEEPDGLGSPANYTEHARAAIEAMREPTEAMQRAIPPQTYTLEHYHGTGHHAIFPYLGSGPLQVWRAMIDAALPTKV